MIWRALADLVLLIHFGFIVFVIVGGFLPADGAGFHEYICQLSRGRWSWNFQAGSAL